MKCSIAINKLALPGKLPQGDPRWGVLNDGFVNQEIDPFDFANAIYCGRPYAAWHNGRRSVENFICGQHIAVDMETGDERSTLDYIINMEFVKAYAGLIYTTPSHTVDDPRCRIVFYLDQPITESIAYKAAIGFVYSLFPGSDSSCIDCSRFFYGSKNCRIELFDNTLPIAHLRRYYARWKPKSAPAAPPPVAKPLRQTKPVENTETEVEQALRKLDPWKMDYPRWVSILAALHDEIGDSALPLAVQWAQGKPGEVEKKWKTFGKFGGRKATLATVFGMVNGKVH